MEKITIKNVKVGTKFCQPELVSPHNEMMTVIDIKVNPDAGEPCKDMWGGTVWNKPKYTIVAIGSITHTEHTFCVQSDDSELQDWLTFIELPEERLNAIYKCRREDVLRIASKNLGEIVKVMQEVTKYPAQLNKDEKMKNLKEYVAKAMLEVF